MNTNGYPSTDLKTVTQDITKLEEQLTSTGKSKKLTLEQLNGFNNEIENNLTILETARSHLDPAANAKDISSIDSLTNRVTVVKRTLSTLSGDTLNQLISRPNSKGPISTFIRSSGLDKIWLKVSSLYSWVRGRDAKIPLELRLIADVAGALPEEGRLTITESLDVFIRYTEREQSSLPTSDGSTSLDLTRKARTMAATLDNVRQDKKLKGPPKALRHMIKTAQADIQQLKPGKKLLLPLGYFDDKQEFHDVLVELQGGNDGKGSMRIINIDHDIDRYIQSSDSEKGEFHPHEQGWEEVDLSAFAERFPLMVELQLPQAVSGALQPSALLPRGAAMAVKLAEKIEKKITGDSTRLNPLDAADKKIEQLPTAGSKMLFELLNLGGAKKDSPRVSKNSSHIGALFASMWTREGRSAEEQSLFELGMGIDLFLQSAEKMDGWLANREHRGLLRMTAKKLLSDLLELDEASADSPRGEKISHWKSEIQTVLERVDNYAATAAAPTGLTTQFDTVVPCPDVTISGVLRGKGVSGSRAASPVAAPLAFKQLAGMSHPDRLATITKWIEQLENLEQKGNYRELSDSLIRAIDKLPGPMSDNWSQSSTGMTQDQMEQYSDQFHRLSQMLVKANQELLVNEDQMPPPIDSFLASTVLQLLTCRMAKEHTPGTDLCFDVRALDPKLMIKQWNRAKEPRSIFSVSIQTRIRECIKFAEANKVHSHPPEEFFSKNRHSNNPLSKIESSMQQQGGLVDLNNHMLYFYRGGFVSEIKDLIQYGSSSARAEFFSSGSVYVNDEKVKSYLKKTSSKDIVWDLEDNGWELRNSRKYGGAELDNPSFVKNQSFSKSLTRTHSRFARICASPVAWQGYISDAGIPTEAAVFIQPKNIPGLTKEEVQDLTRIQWKEPGVFFEHRGERPRSSPTSNAEHAISYLLAHPNLFGKPVAQTIFEVNVFTQDLLVDCIRKHPPEYARQVNDQLKSCYDSLKDDNIEAAAYLLRFVDFFEQATIVATGSPDTDELSSERINIIDEIKNLLKRGGAQPADRQGSIYTNLLTALSEQIARDDTLLDNNEIQGLLVGAHIRTKRSEVYDTVLDARNQRFMDDLTMRIKKQQTSENFSDDTFSKGLQHALGLPNCTEWKFDNFPVLTSTAIKKKQGYPVNATLEMKIADGVLLVNGKTVGQPSQALTNSQAFKRHFPNGLGLCQVVKETDPKTKETVITYTPVDSETEKAASWALIERSGVDKEGSSVSTHSYFSKVPGKNGKEQVWGQYIRFGAQENTKDAIQDLPAHVSAIVGDNDCFIDAANPKRIVVCDKKTGLQVGSLRLDSKKRIKEYVRADGMHLLNPGKHQTFLERFEGLEDPKQVILFGQPGSSKVAEVVMPRLLEPNGSPVTFKVMGSKKSQRIICKGIEGKHLAPSIFHSEDVPPGSQLPLPEDFKDYLMFRGPDEKHIIRMALHPRIPVGGDRRQLKHEKWLMGGEIMRNATSTEQQILLECDLNREGVLESKSRSGNLYLAYVFLTHKDYTRAAACLEKAGSSELEGKEYQTTLKLLREWNDPTPNGNACKLRLLHFIVNQRQTVDVVVDQSGGRKNVREENLNLYRSLATCLAQYNQDLKVSRAGIPKGSHRLPLTELLPENLLKAIKETVPFDAEMIAKGVVDREGSSIAAASSSQQNLPRMESEGFAEQLFYHMNEPKQSNLWKRSKFFAINPHTRLVRNFGALADRILTLSPTDLEFKRLELEIQIAQPRDLQGLGTTSKHYLQQLISWRKEHPNEKKPDAASFLGTNLNRKRGLIRRKWELESFTGENSLENTNPMPSDHPVNKVAAFLAWIDDQHATTPAPNVNPSLTGQDTELIETSADTINAAKELVSRSSASSLEKTTLESMAASALPGDPNELYKTQMKKRMEQADTMLEEIEKLPKKEVAPELATPSKGTEEVIGPEYAKFREKVDQVFKPGTLTKKEELENESIATGVRVTQREGEDAFAPLINESSDPCVQRFASEVTEDTKAGIRGENEKDQPLFVDWTQMMEVRAGVDEVLRVGRENLNANRSEIFKLLYPSGSPEGGAKARIGREGQMPIDRIIGLYATGQLSTLKGLNPALNETTLETTIESYLKNSVLVAHFERASNNLDDAVRSVNEGKAISQNSLRVLRDSLKIQREYKTDDSDPHYKEFLLIEYGNGFFIRSDQVETIRTMLDDPNAVRKLIMGAGKSKVLLPVILRARANGSNLMMAVLPDWLFQTNLSDLNETSRNFFGQKPVPFVFDRNPERLEIPELQRSYHRLVSAVQEKNFVATTKSSVLSLAHAYQEQSDLLVKALEKGASPSEITEIQERLEVMAKILALFKERGEAIIDEIDSVLDIRLQDNYAAKADTPLDSTKLTVGHSVMQTLMAHLESDTKPELKTFADAVKNDRQSSIHPNKRQELLKALSEQLFHGLPPNTLSQENKDDFVKYLTGGTLPPNRMTAGIPTFLHKLKGKNEEQFFQISEMRKFVNQGLRNAFDTSCNVNWGRHPDRPHEVIPYKGAKQPSVGSEFDDEVERITYYLMDYAQNGVDTTSMQERVDLLVERAGAEKMRAKKQDISLSIDNTPTGKEFSKFLKQIGLEDLTLSSLRDGGGVEQLCDSLREHPEASIRFCDRYIMSEIRVSSEQLRGTALDFGDLIASLGGFTGTDWNAKTYHEKTNHKTALGVDGKSIALLMKKQKAGQLNIRVLEKEKDPMTQVTEMMAKGGYHVGIDIGSYGKAINNEEIVDNVLKASDDQFKVGVYTNKQGVIVAKNKGSAESQKLAHVQSDNPADRVTWYSLFIGTDIKQADTARGLATIQEKQFLKDLLQGIWRLRKLGEGQSVDFVVTPEICKLITGDEATPPTLDQLLQFCVKNQALREAEDNYQAEIQRIKGKIPGVMKRQLEQLPLKGGKDWAHTLQKLHKFYRPEIFSARQQQDEGDAAVGEKKDPHVALKEQKDSLVAKYTAILKQMEQDPDAKMLEPYIQELNAAITELTAQKPIDKAFLPKEVEAASAVGGEVKSQQQQKTQQQTQQQSQVQVETAVSTGEVRLHEERRTIYKGFEKSLLNPNSTKQITPSTDTKFAPVSENSVEQSKFERVIEMLKRGDIPGDLSEELLEKVTEKREDREVQKGQNQDRIQEEIDEICDRICSLNPSGFLSHIGNSTPLYNGIFLTENWYHGENKLAPSTEETKGASIPTQALYEANRKRSNTALVVKQHDGSFNVVIGTRREADEYFREFISRRQEGQKYEQGSDPTPLAAVLVNVDGDQPFLFNGWSNEGGKVLNPFSSDEQDSKEFTLACAKIRFFNGQLDYNNAEQEQLKRWLGSDPKEARELFKAHILPILSPDDKNRWKSSDLHGVLYPEELVAA
ncbi:hypothetical protein SCG7086_BB_00020 [Chlamydiales bacterium SCGC AG-110-P3]|nr:hypothetical protein SCG7086_BB_00020 [Chlamydiales bacterium SCGC AG-110-P3]